jgi:hypothetical protein
MPMRTEKNVWGKISNTTCKIKDVYGKTLIFLMLKHWMVNKSIAAVFWKHWFWNIDSETFIICLKHVGATAATSIGRTKNLKHLAFIIWTCITRVWNLYIFSLKQWLSVKFVLEHF